MTDNSFLPLAVEFGSTWLVFLCLVCLALIFSSYIKIVTVLSIVRVGLGASSVTSAFVTSGLAIALTLFVMSPTLQSSARAMRGSQSAQSFQSATNQEKALMLQKGMDEWKNFLARHSHAKELEAFAKVSKRLSYAQVGGDKNVRDELSKKDESKTKGENKDNSAIEYDWSILAPAFIVSELKEAFTIGLSLLLPFFVVEILIANVLVAVGLTQLSPHVVSFPFKLLLFVLADGWSIITTNLVATYA